MSDQIATTEQAQDDPCAPFGGSSVRKLRHEAIHALGKADSALREALSKVLGDSAINEAVYALRGQSDLNPEQQAERINTALGKLDGISGLGSTEAVESIVASVLEQRGQYIEQARQALKQARTIASERDFEAWKQAKAANPGLCGSYPKGYGSYGSSEPYDGPEPEDEDDEDEEAEKESTGEPVEQE